MDSPRSHISRPLWPERTTPRTDEAPKAGKPLAPELPGWSLLPTCPWGPLPLFRRPYGADGQGFPSRDKSGRDGALPQSRCEAPALLRPEPERPCRPFEHSIKGTGQGVNVKRQMPEMTRSFPAQGGRFRRHRTLAERRRDGFPGAGADPGSVLVIATPQDPTEGGPVCFRIGDLVSSLENRPFLAYTIFYRHLRLALFFLSSRCPILGDDGSGT